MTLAAYTNNTTIGNNGRRRVAEIREELEQKSPEEIRELIRIHTDSDGSYRVQSWLDGKFDLCDDEIQRVLV